MAGVTAYDNEDKWLTDKIEVTGEVDVTKARSLRAYLHGGRQ